MEYLFLFLLLFAVLAAAWFYFQRAKARDAVKSDGSTATADAAATADEAH